MGATSRCETVVGVFDTRDRAERAVAELRAAGYRDDRIGTGAVLLEDRLPGAYTGAASR